MKRRSNILSLHLSLQSFYRSGYQTRNHICSCEVEPLNLHSKFLREICHCLRDLDLLRTDSFTAPASDTCAGLLLLRIRRQRHRSDKASFCKTVLIIQVQKFRDIQLLRTVADTIVARCTRKDFLLQHAVCDAKEILHLLFAQRFIFLICMDVCLKLFHI